MKTTKNSVSHDETCLFFKFLQLFELTSDPDTLARQIDRYKSCT